MKNLLICLGLATALTGCITNPFVDPDPVLNTPVAYAAHVCDVAGPEATACVNATTQASMKCYRTLGRVNCFLSDDPFGTNSSARSLTVPVDGMRVVTVPTGAAAPF
ncbi:hypothetical protein [Minwuia sp.]|uniref:hypothetical protein n=1 Tax=Minwuia sp. TaxID=2493630 RepID=UPI003A8F7BB8